MFRAHVLIVRRSKLYYTASGIIKLKQVSGLKLLKVTKITKIYKYEHIVVIFFCQQNIKKVTVSSASLLGNKIRKKQEVWIFVHSTV